MNKLSRHSVFMLLLGGIFLAPGLAAIYFYQHPQHLGGHTTNKGTFVQPALKVKALTTRSTPNNLSKIKWYFVLWYPDNCDISCLKSFDQLERIRLSLGRHYYEVHQVLLSGQSIQQLNISGVQLSEKEAQILHAYAREPRIFIANREGYLILSYPTTVDSNDVYQDIKHLL